MLGLDLSEEPRAIREAKEEGILSVVTRQLTRRLGQALSKETKSRLASLSLLELEDLSEALLDFTSLTDLQDWLERGGYGTGFGSSGTASIRSATCRKDCLWVS